MGFFSCTLVFWSRQVEILSLCSPLGLTTLSNLCHHSHQGKAACGALEGMEVLYSSSHHPQGISYKMPSWFCLFHEGVTAGWQGTLVRDIGNQETDLKNKGMRMALLVTNSSPAVERRAGNTSSQNEETFILLSSRGNSTEFSPEKVET